MARPLQRTFDVLAATANPVAVDLLVSGLRLSDDEIRVGCLAALLKRRSTRGNIEIVRSLRLFSAEMRAAVERSSASLSHAIRQSLVHGDGELRRNALDLVRWFEDYNQIPSLLNLLEDRRDGLADEAAGIIRDLVGRLYQHLQFGESHEPAGPYLRDAPRIRHQLLTCLDSACQRYPAHHCPDVVESLLVLGTAEDLQTRKIFQQERSEVRQVMNQLLRTSTHPGVMNLLVQAMHQNYPHPLATAALSERSDPEFICHVLRTWPRRLSSFQQKNFRAIRRIEWLAPENLRLETIPPVLHRALIQLLLASGVPEEHKLAVLEWVVRHGSPDGRLAATDVLCDLEDHKVHEVILEGLESDEPDLQAWATSQLRQREVPDAFRLLIQRLDSPLAEVREAARHELEDFNIHRVLEFYEQLDPVVQRRVGLLIQKIDPLTIERLRHEMAHAIRRKRIRAARAALALGMQDHLHDALVQMASDSDALVRRTGVEVLGHVRHARAEAALKEAMSDVSPRVREAAARALQQQQISEAHDAQRT